MKKAYEKPALLKTAVLSKVTAIETCASGYTWVDGDNGAGCVQVLN